MFKFVMICALFGVALAVPVQHGHAASRSDDVHAEVKSLSSDVRADGFDSDLVVSNSIQQSASGDAHGNIHGSYSWISPEGEHVEVKYVADENGYQPTGAWIPTPPPIPKEILRSLEWLATHAKAEETHYSSRHH